MVNEKQFRRLKKLQTYDCNQDKANNAYSKAEVKAGFIAMTLYDIKVQIANTRIGNQAPLVDSRFK